MAEKKKIKKWIDLFIQATEEKKCTVATNLYHRDNFTISISIFVPLQSKCKVKCKKSTDNSNDKINADFLNDNFPSEAIVKKRKIHHLIKFRKRISFDKKII